MKRVRQESEEDKLLRMRRQLLIAGVLCVAAVVFVLWFISLRRTLTSNRAVYGPPFKSWSAAQAQLGGAWDEFKGQLESLK